MKAQKKPKTIRRSVALPESLANEAMAVAPAEPNRNFNRVVVLALKEFIASRKQKAFAESMERMAADPDVISECSVTHEGLMHTETDGLSHA